MGFVCSPVVCRAISSSNLVQTILADKDIWTNKASSNNCLLKRNNEDKNERKLKKTTSLPQVFSFFLQWIHVPICKSKSFACRQTSLFLTKSPQWLRLYFQKNSRYASCSIVGTILIHLIFSQLTICYVEEPGKWNKWQSDSIMHKSMTRPTISSYLNVQSFLKKKRYHGNKISRWPVCIPSK